MLEHLLQTPSSFACLRANEEMLVASASLRPLRNLLRNLAKRDHKLKISTEELVVHDLRGILRVELALAFALLLLAAGPHPPSKFVFVPHKAKHLKKQNETLAELQDLAPARFIKPMRETLEG